MATLGIQITDSGPVWPSYDDIVAELRILYRSIYGSDVNLDNDSQDGQWIAVQAQQIYDVNIGAVAVYNQYSPTTARGAALSSQVKINGIRRKTPSNSQAVVTIGGTVGTIIEAGVVGDNQNLQTQWALPATVTIPGAGTIDVTATCTALGSTGAGAGTLTQILTPTRGWQSVTNADPATPGSPVETDAQLRRRQSASTSKSAEAIVEGIYGSVGDIAAVNRLAIYENDTDAPDADGIPAHSIAVVVEGGDTVLIAEAIASKKAPGTGTAGTTSEVVVDSHGIPNTINFYPITEVLLEVEVHLQSLTGYTAAIGDAIAQAVVDFVNGLSIGEDSYLARLYTPSNLGGTGDGATYVITQIKQSKSPAAPAVGDIVIAFNEGVLTDLDHVTIVAT